MSSTDRQNKLIVAEDWKRIYQSFKNADFKSYDFDNLRRTMIGYLRENYPEDFNDYIESSEYLALIDMIAFLGQNLAFRFDLNARDNFLELAERRESILRLARLVSYNAKRSVSASGLLKFSTISTTETIYDSNGRNLAKQTIVWNDPANPNWYEQFIKVINAGLTNTSQYGNPIDSAYISGIPVDQYRFNATNSGLPVYGFSKSVEGRNMNFEVVSSTFRDSNTIYEEAPRPGNSFAFVYKDDGKGPASSNTGFFSMFKQGNLQSAAFSVVNPSTNESVNIDAPNINNDDVWLYGLDAYGLENTLWSKVDAVIGNNVIYNSLRKDERNIYSVLSRTSDRISLAFADGLFGNLPQGSFKTYYRMSNNQSYSINPSDIKNVSVSIPYQSSTGGTETVTISMSLKYIVNNASASESSASIKLNAPASYYAQGRMITGEDYNVVPQTTNQEIAKIKSLNRVSSGISRYFDLIDATGMYSHTNLFGVDGIVYKEYYTDKIQFSPTSRTDISNVIVNSIQPIISKANVRDFYYDQYDYVVVRSGVDTIFKQVTKTVNASTGYFVDSTSTNNPKPVGNFTSSNLRYVVVGSLLKYVAPDGKVFDKNNTLIITPSNLAGTSSYIWATVVSVTSDGTANNTGVLSNGYGPVVLSVIIPDGAILSEIIPKYTLTVGTDVQTKMNDLIFSNKEFGMRYDTSTLTWKIINQTNLDKRSPFSTVKTGDTSNRNADSSWVILFEVRGGTYTVTYRALRYVFESAQEVRFFFDNTEKVYDSKSGRIIKDTISVLAVNHVPDSNNPFNTDIHWNIVDEYRGADGYIDTKKISVSFTDDNDDGIVDNPDIFKEIVSPTTDIESKFIFEHRRVTPDGTVDYYYVDNSDGLITIVDTSSVISGMTIQDDQLVYIIDEAVVKTYYKGYLTLNTEYKGYIGRDSLKFQYVHASGDTSRLDPSSTNIMDVYVMTRSYDNAYRSWINGVVPTLPLPPSSDELFVNFGGKLNQIKATSDEIIYHPVKYKNLFGSSADPTLQGTFKVVKNPGVVSSDNDVISRVLVAINQFFTLDNWDFGDTFYFGELSTYIMQQTAPLISNIVLVPKQGTLSFGSLYEIQSNSDEIFISSATVNDIEVITEITAKELNASGVVVTSTLMDTSSIQSQ